MEGEAVIQARRMRKQDLESKVVLPESDGYEILWT